MKGFEALSNFSLKKEVTFEQGNGSIKNIPVIVSPGAVFREIFEDRTHESFSFTPYGIISPGEKIILSKEEIIYLLNKEQIKIISFDTNGILLHGCCFFIFTR